MKTPSLLLNLLALGGVAILASCASANYKQSASTASALSDSANRVSQGGVLIDQTLAALDDLVNNPQPDLRQQFKTFSASVDELAATDKDVGGKAEDMKAKGAAYFERWDQELAKIQNEDIRNRAESRKQDVAGRFHRIAAHYDEAKTAFRPFMSDLRDVQRFLATDLTTGGLSAAKSFAAKANADAKPLHESFSKLAGEFKGLGVALSPTAPAKT